MAQTAATSPQTCADDATVGDTAWSNPNNAKVSDDIYATVTVGRGDTSHYLKATNFGFAIPTGVTINGILVEIESKAASSDSIVDSNVRIVKADGAFGTINKAATTYHWPTEESYKSYGSETDLWGETWTVTDINDVDFGVGVAVGGVMFTVVVASIDHIRITIYYASNITGISTITGAQTITF